MSWTTDIFITTGKKYPIFGTQWHPEKCQFEWTPKEVIDHSADAVFVGQYMANFFVNQGTTILGKFLCCLSNTV